MKITEIEYLPAGKYLFIKVHTDSGMYGLGEAGAWGYLDACQATLEKMATYLVGKDPFAIEHHWNYLYRSMYFRGSIILSAIAAIDLALWDIKGKALGVPIYELLGGKTRDKVRTYQAVFSFTAEEMAAECRKLQKAGYTAARLLLIDDPGKELSPKDAVYNHRVSHYIEKVKACRQAVGEDFDLILECHRSLTPAEGLTLAREVAPYRPLFIEDPIAPDNLDVMANLTQTIPIPLATGERFISLQEFAHLFRHNGAQYVRPDLCTVGGITAGKKIASLAEANEVLLVPHNPLGPVSTAANLQLDASIENLLIQEFPSFYTTGDEAGMMTTAFEVTDGYITIPDGPGLGIDLIPDLQEKYPPAYRDLSCKIGFDGAIVTV